MVRDWSEVIGPEKVRISRAGKAYTTNKRYEGAARELNDRLKGVKEGKEIIRSVAIGSEFLKNFEHNAKQLKELKGNSIATYNNRNTIKPGELVAEAMAYEEECKGKHEPVTIAGLCHHIRLSRSRLMIVIKQKGYDGARVCIENMLMKYAENYLFTGKNTAGVMFYLKNAYPEHYQDKTTTETNVKISLVDLSKKADKLAFELNKSNIIKGEMVNSKSLPEKGDRRSEIDKQYKESVKNEKTEFENIEKDDLYSDEE